MTLGQLDRCNTVPDEDPVSLAIKADVIFLAQSREVVTGMAFVDPSARNLAPDDGRLIPRSSKTVRMYDAMKMYDDDMKDMVQLADNYRIIIHPLRAARKPRNLIRAAIPWPAVLPICVHPPKACATRF